MAGARRRQGAGGEGAELEVALVLPDPDARRTRRELYEQIRNAIRAGRLAAGLRMPASRRLAERLGVSRNTITTVYDLLASEGLLTTRPGAGAFVAAPHAPDMRRPPALDMAGRVRPASHAWAPTVFGPHITHPFTVGAPDLGLFPWDLWRKVVGGAWRAYGRAPQRPPPEGSAALREGVAGHLSFARGIACRPEDIVVTAGAQQAFDLLARALVRAPGTAVAVEEPCYPPTRLAFAAAGARVMGVPVDDEGMVIEALPPEAEVICVTPSHQFPLGSPMSPTRRQALLAHARRTGAVVIEDDYDGEFRFDGRPLEALQTLDLAQQVIYVGTFSKSLFPELKLGYVVAPPWLIGPLAAVHQIAGRPALPPQLATAAFISEGHLARHVRRMRRLYAERRAVLLETVAEAGQGLLRPIPSAAGLHVAFRAPPGIEARTLAVRAAAAGVGAYPASHFAFEDRSPNAIVLGYGVLAAERVRTGALALLEAARSLS